MAKKKTERQKAKERAWASFSAYIRTRDCLRFSGFKDMGRCVTCKRDYPYAQLQAGHFIDGRGNSVLFDERLVYSQCKSCNLNPPNGKGGNLVEYFAFMEKEWGREMIDEFRALKKETRPYKTHDFESIEQEFKDKTKELFT